MNTQDNNTQGQLSHLYELCYRAYSGTSFSPEKRATSVIAEFEQALTQDLASVPEHYQPKYTEKFIGYFTKWMHAKSRCISSMITGPANFPVARAEKYNNWEHNSYVEFETWRKKVLAALARSERKKNALPELEKAIKDLNQRKVNHEAMKVANTIIRKHKGAESALPELLEKTGWKESTCRQILQPDYMGRFGFPQFELTNNLANIKRLEQRVKELQAKETLKTKIQETGADMPEITINGAKIVQDVSIDRIKIVFDGKPAANVITALKQSGFKWSPHWGAWVRKLTSNAQYAAKHICTTELKAA